MQLSNKQLLNKLEEYLDFFGFSKDPEMLASIAPGSEKPHAELRNYRKKMVKLFKGFSYDRKLDELAGFEMKVQQKLMHEQNEALKNKKEDTEEGVLV